MVAALATALVAPAGAATAPERIVAVGDIHGAYEGFLAVLEAAGLADAEGRWTGGDATLVQTGDFLDRGTEVRQVMDLLMSLQEQAAAAGGRVIVLLGNHEGMNLTRQFRDVSPEAYVAFADARSPARRKRAYRQWVGWVEEQAALTGRLVGSTDRDAWMAAHPPGYLEYLEALAPEGRYGRWLRTLPTVTRIGDTIFLHGGISPEVAPLPLPEINAKAAGELDTFDRHYRLLVEREVILPSFELRQMAAAVAHRLEALAALPPEEAAAVAEAPLLGKAMDDFKALGEWSLFDSSGPLWFRGFAQWTAEEGAPLIAEIAAAYEAERFVVGHTAPDPRGRIQARFDGKVFLIDTGMLSEVYTGGRGSALEIAAGAITAIYPGGERSPLLPAAEKPASGGSPPPPASGIRPAGSGIRLAGNDIRLTAGSAAAAEADPCGGRWLGPDGAPLPFRSDAEVLEFLRQADVVDQERIPEGVTGPQKLLLGWGGVRAHAVFRHVEDAQDRVRLDDGKWILHLYDRHENEVAAYELSRLLGMENLPPALMRKVGRQEGSIQLWLEQAITEKKRLAEKRTPPDVTRWNRQLADMRVFDNLVNNIDRNQGNILYGPDWNLWLIDHTRTFGRDTYLPAPEKVTRCSRPLWQAIRDLDEEEVKARLEPYIGKFERRALLERRRELIALIEKRIAERGEAQVIFDPAAVPAEMPAATPAEAPAELAPEVPPPEQPQALPAPPPAVAPPALARAPFP